MEEDPTKIPEMAQEDHAEFRARFVRNHPDIVLLDSNTAGTTLVNGMVPRPGQTERQMWAVRAELFELLKILQRTMQPWSTHKC